MSPSTEAARRYVQALDAMVVVGGWTRAQPEHADAAAIVERLLHAMSALEDAREALIASLRKTGEGWPRAVLADGNLVIVAWSASDAEEPLEDRTEKTLQVVVLPLNRIDADEITLRTLVEVGASLLGPQCLGQLPHPPALDLFAPSPETVNP